MPFLLGEFGSPNYPRYADPGDYLNRLLLGAYNQFSALSFLFSAYDEMWKPGSSKKHFRTFDPENVSKLNAYMDFKEGIDPESAPLRVDIDHLEPNGNSSANADYDVSWFQFQSPLTWQSEYSGIEININSPEVIDHLPVMIRVQTSAMGDGDLGTFIDLAYIQNNQIVMPVYWTNLPGTQISRITIHTGTPWNYPIGGSEVFDIENVRILLGDGIPDTTIQRYALSLQSGANRIFEAAA